MQCGSRSPMRLLPGSQVRPEFIRIGIGVGVGVGIGIDIGIGIGMSRYIAVRSGKFPKVLFLQ